MLKRLILPIVLLGGFVFFMKRRASRKSTQSIADPMVDPGAST